MSKRKSASLKNTTEKDETQKVVSALEDIMRLDIISSRASYCEDFQNIINRLQDQTFRMAVVGEFSSGKSTFLNALIGQDILKHGAQETTATITEIENVSSETDETSFDVYYQNGEKEVDLPIELLTEYTATASTTHEVAREISKVVIKSKVIEADYPICFVDTPGLNGLADLHREKTIDQIKNSHACIYLLQVRGLGNSDIEFLKYITQYQHNILFIQNFIDELKELEGETPEEKIEKQEEIIKENILCDGRELTYEIIPVSSREALIARDKNLSDYENIQLTDEQRDALYRQSGFDVVINKITELMKANNRRAMQQKATVSVALQLLEHIQEVVSLQKKIEEEAWNDSPEARKKQGYEKILEKLKSEKSAYYEMLQNFIDAETGEIRRSIGKKIDKYLEETRKTVKDELNGMFTVEDIHAYLQKEHMPQYLSEQISKCESDCNIDMEVRFENLINSALLRIENYTGYATHGASISEFNADMIKVSQQYRSFEQEEDEIHELESELSEIEASLKADKVMIERKRAEVEEKRKTLKKLKNEDSQNVERRNQERKALGSKPEVETKYRRETQYEYRGGFGFLDWLLGPKEVKKNVPYSDDSKQREWEDKKNKIEASYQKTKMDIASQNRVLTQKINEFEKDIKHAENMEPEKQKEINEVRDLLQAKIKSLEEQKEKALQEYLRNLRNGIIENVTQYLDNDVAVRMKDNLEEAIKKNKDIVTERIRNLFEISFQERVRSLENILNDHRDETQLQKTEETVSKIENTRKILEDYLCQA